MRILHTSDWHLGQHFIGKSRAAEHQAFFHWLKQQVITLDVDVVVVAGDIFDTATPPSYARELYHQLIVDLQPTGVQLVLLGGNHDSVAVLQESASLLKCLHTTVVPAYHTDPNAHLIPLIQKNGDVGAVLAAVPFYGHVIYRSAKTVKASPGKPLPKNRPSYNSKSALFIRNFIKGQQRSPQH